MLRCPACHRLLEARVPACPHCGAAIPPPRWRVYTRHWVSLAVAVGLFVLTTVAPLVVQHFRIGMPFRTSLLAREAVARANEHVRAAQALGQPISAGWFVKGYIRDDETGWSEAKIWVPVRGPRGEGSLYVAAGRGSAQWVFSELRLSVGPAEVDLLERPGLSDEGKRLRPGATLHLVPLGQLTTVNVQALAAHYRDRLALDVRVAPSVALDSGAYDHGRQQFVAEALLVTLRQALPETARDPGAVVIGVTQQDMYIGASRWRYAFSYRAGRTAVVSAARMRPMFARLRGLTPLAQTRVRKMITKNVGILVYGLPTSQDPSSVLYDQIAGVEDLDVMEETFEGLGGQAVVSSYANVHREAPVVAALKPRATPSADTEYPCFALTALSENARAHGEVAQCPPDMRWSAPVDTVEVDFRYGALVVCRSDLVVPDIVPLVLTRCLRAHDDRSRTFGTGGYLAYDIFPVGSRQPYTWSDLILPDGSRLPYERISRGTAYADAVYEHTDSPTVFRGSMMRWNGNGWDLTFRDGALWQFPDAYAATRPAEAALRFVRDAQGRTLGLERDRHGNLVRLTSPSGKALRFEYDGAHRVTRVTDGGNASVGYEYDVGGRLMAVKDDRRTLVRYAWQGTEIRGATGPDGEPLFTIDYTTSLPSRLVLRGTTVWRLTYAVDRRRTFPVTEVTIEHRDGRRQVIKVADSPRPIER